MVEIGQTISHYRITEKLGQGGMGEVFLAHDVSLDRKVALKFLPDIFSGDPERLARFEREAKLLASLNHPNIATIHGLEQADGKRFLAMELAEGETLAERIDKAALPMDEALEICRQIAEGLEYAHEHRVIHRDLKPANVKLRPDGVVKVLDFGLARALQADAVPADTSHSPTITAAATRAGMILGTAAYMSPEQARGWSVDRRADIWALGCVLFEMLTGRQTFQAETTSDTLAALLRAEPDWSTLPPEMPTSLRDLLCRCLAKDPKKRMHADADVRLEIEEILAAAPMRKEVEPLPDLTSARATWRPLIIGIILGAAVISLVGVGIILSGVWPRRKEQEVKPLRVSIVHTEGSEVGAPAISPDGRRIAYRARRADGMPMLWVRDLDMFDAKPLPGTEDACFPF